MNKHSPYFDQESPIAEIVGMIADLDVSRPYELYATAVFKCKQGYLVVGVSGCSCWPDSGGTSQEFCRTRADVDKQLRGEWRELLTLCQQRNWKIAVDK